MLTTVGARQPAIVEYLQHPANYLDRPRSVDCIETHISWVFLTDRFAYKLKKPVRYSFLDFSTPEKRHQACLDEVRLNRRLAPDIYLEAVPVRLAANGRLSWSDAGVPTDWMVKMRRLPEEACLHFRLTQDRLTPRELDILADYLADFYAQQPPLTLIPEQVRNRIVAQIRSNQSDLCEFLPQQINRINLLHAAQLRYVTTHKELLDGRVCDGRFVEGHGDLRPEHIYLTPRPAIIDCLEFSAPLRQLDIADELSFLAMECDLLKQSAVGEQILARYAEVTGDRPPTSLLAFYKAYRACVRAKVHALRATQSNGQARVGSLKRAGEYLESAEQYLRHLGRGLLVAVAGLMGTGKTTLASALADMLGATLLQSDQIRRQKFGTSSSPANFNAGIYRPEMREDVYRQLFECSGHLLQSGATVILDATFTSAAHRQRIRELAAAFDADFLLVQCECPREVALQRIEQRRAGRESASEARRELYDRQAALWEPPVDGPELLRIDSELPVVQQVEQVFEQLEKRLQH